MDDYYIEDTNGYSEWDRICPFEELESPCIKCKENCVCYNKE